MEKRRHDRLAEALKRELSTLLTKEIRNPRLKGAIVTRVEFDREMKVAQVGVCRSLIGEYREPSLAEEKELLLGLDQARSFLFEKLRKALRIKMMPELKFRYDRSLSEASVVWSKMSQWKANEREGQI